MTETRLPSLTGRHRASALCVSALVLTLTAPPLCAEVIDRVLAVVGSEIVTLSDVRAAEVFRLAEGAVPSPADALAYLIHRELMLREVDRYAAPEPEPEALDRRVTEVRALFPTQELYEQALARTAMTEGRLRAVVAENLRIEIYLEQRFGAAAQPTPDDLLRYYREHAGEFTRGGRLAPLEEVQPALQQKLAGERRAALVADWLDRLQRRASVRVVDRRQ